MLDELTNRLGEASGSFEWNFKSSINSLRGQVEVAWEPVEKKKNQQTIACLAMCVVVIKAGEEEESVDNRLLVWAISSRAKK